MACSLLLRSQILLCDCCSFFFFFNDTATTEIYTLSLHDALPISRPSLPAAVGGKRRASFVALARRAGWKTLGAGTLYPDAHSRRSDAPRVSNWRGFTCPVREARGARVPRSCNPLPYSLTTRVPRPRAQTFPLFALKFV